MPVIGTAMILEAVEKYEGKILTTGILTFYATLSAIVNFYCAISTFNSQQYWTLVC